MLPRAAPVACPATGGPSRAAALRRPSSTMRAMNDGPGSELELADWRRRVARMYADVRFLYRDDPVAAWQHWRTEREDLFREHPQSPLPPADRAAFRGRYWGYDARLAFELEVQPDEREAGAPAKGLESDSLGPMAGLALALPTSGGGTMAFRRIGWLDTPFPEGARRLGLYWMEGYAGGLFVPFRDATNGAETYGAGRYLLDAAKSADLGGDPVRRTLVCDFNFSYQPSCAFDPKWACPLAPPENRLDIPVRAGERIA
jgi:uncharacterized protein (DUF1684 family)